MILYTCFLMCMYMYMYLYIAAFCIYFLCAGKDDSVQSGIDPTSYLPGYGSVLSMYKYLHATTQYFYI